MDLEIIREFQILAMTQNVSKAARELHITPSCLSKHMTALEQETKVHLLVHGSKCVSLTPAGKMFARKTSAIISQWDDCIRSCRQAQEAAKDELGKLRIAIYLDGNSANDLLFELGCEYRDSRPGLDLRFSKLIGLSPVSALFDGLFDVAVDLKCGDFEAGLSHQEIERLMWLPITTDPLVVWFRTNGVFGSQGELTLEKLDRVPILTSISNVYDYMREATKSAFSAMGASPYFEPVHFEEDSPATFFMSDFSENSAMITTVGMVEDSILSKRGDISHQVIKDERMQATAYLLGLRGNLRSEAFFAFAKEHLADKSGRLRP